MAKRPATLPFGGNSELVSNAWQAENPAEPKCEETSQLKGFSKIQQQTNQGVHVIAEGRNEFIHVGAKGECIFAIL